MHLSDLNLGGSQTSSTITFTTTPTAIATANVTVTTGVTKIKLTFITPQIFSTVNGDRIQVSFKEGATEKQRFYVIVATAANPSAPSQYSAVFDAPSPGSYTYSVSGVRDTGSGTINVYANAATNSYIQFLVEAT